MQALTDFFSLKHVPKDQRAAYRIWLIAGTVCLAVSIALVVYVIEGVRAPAPHTYFRRNVSARLAPFFADRIAAAKAAMPKAAVNKAPAANAKTATTSKATNALKTNAKK